MSIQSINNLQILVLLLNNLLLFKAFTRVFLFWRKAALITSKNNFSDAYKNKLDDIEEGATNVVVEDNLTSTSTENALSANQGKVLKGLVDGKQKTITSGTSSPSGGSNGDYYAQYF